MHSSLQSLPARQQSAVPAFCGLARQWTVVSPRLPRNRTRTARRRQTSRVSADSLRLSVGSAGTSATPRAPLHARKRDASRGRESKQCQIVHETVSLRHSKRYYSRLFVPGNRLNLLRVRPSSKPEASSRHGPTGKMSRLHGTRMGSGRAYLHSSDHALSNLE